jgi:geranylgeranyl transferase type-1 subunit beta
MTYTALCILLMLEDDLSRVNKAAIVRALRYLQQPDGSYSSTAGRSENDMRFLYCACTISTILNDWSGVDRDLALQYVSKSQSYDFVFGQAPGQEGHGGSTYCAVAACALMGRLDALGFSEWPGASSQVRLAAGHHGPATNFTSPALGLVDFLCRRQISGFQGRIGKDPDACYSWWIGSSLHILGHFDQLDAVQLRNFLLACQAPIGGFGKYPDTHPDILHTYFSLCGMSFLGEQGLQPLHCSLGLTMRAARRIPSVSSSLGDV